MSKKAVLHDGTTLEFPDDTPDEVMDRAVQEFLASPEVGKAAAEGRSAETATGRFHQAPPPPRPSFTDTLSQSARDFGTNLSNGFFSLGDMASQAGGAVIDGANALAQFAMTGGGASSGTVGNPSGSDRVANALDFGSTGPAPTMRAFNDRINPGAYDRSSTGFLTEALGGALIPLGPASRAAPAFKAPTPAVAAPAATSAKAIPNALGVINAGAREGVRVMTSDVLPPTTFIGKSARAIGERIPIAGTASPRAAQQTERIEAVKGLLRDFGATEADDAVESVSKDLIATRGKELTRLTTAKNRVIEGIQGVVPTPLASRAIDEQVRKLRGINEEAYKPVIDKLLSFERQLESGKTLAQIEGNRKLLGDLFADPSLAAIKSDGQKALNAIYGPLREDMGAFIETAGGAGARARWKGANDRLAAMAGEMDASAFKGLLSKADTTPEAAAKIIFSKTPSDMQRLAGNLSPAGKQKAQAAILYKAAEGATENGVISPQKFANAMEAMDKAAGTFFAPADKVRIEGMVRMLKATQRASEAAAFPLTGVQNAAAAMGAGFVSLFGLGGGVAAAGASGMLARAYESQAVRNALLRVGRTKPGTRAEGVAMRDLSTVMARVSPTAANDVGDALAASPGSVAASTEQENEARRIPPQQ